MKPRATIFFLCVLSAIIFQSTKIQTLERGKKTASADSVTLGEAVDNTDLVWTTGGDADWFGQTEVFFFDGDAAQSGDIENNQSSWIQTEATGPGLLAFLWKVTSVWTRFRMGFYIDGIKKTECSSYLDWEFEAFQLPSGNHTLKWDYAPWYHPEGDAGFLDMVLFATDPVIWVLSPRGGEIWTQKTIQPIRWLSHEGAGSEVKIDLYKGEKFRCTIVEGTANDGSYDWEVPASEPPGSDYRIKISSTADPEIQGISNNAFTIKDWRFFNGCLELSGNNFAEAAAHSELDLGEGNGGSFTVEAWTYVDFYDTSPSIGRNIIDKPESYLLYMQRYYSSEYYKRRCYGCLGYTLWLPSGQPKSALSEQVPCFSVGWHHVALVFDEETEEAVIYLDGDVFLTPHYVGPAINHSPMNLKVGEKFRGAVDEVRISDIVRYSAPFDVPASPFACDQYTRALWHFDEAEGVNCFHDTCGADNILWYNGIPGRDDLLGTWAGQGVYYRNSDSGSWVKLASPALQVAAGDLDCDGYDDLIGEWAGQSVWLKCSESGAWVKLSSTAAHIAAGDMNGDGKCDFLGTWDGQGVYYCDNETLGWVKMATPSTMVAAGDLDDDGTDDLIGIWPAQGGVWVKYSATGIWARLSSTADWIGCGDMNGDGRDDFLGTWAGQGVYYKDSAGGAWIKMASPASQIAAGDLDGDGTDDLVGIWPGQGGVWVKNSTSSTWQQLSSTADWIACGKMTLEDGEGAVALVESFGLMAEEGPPAGSDYRDLSAAAPGGTRFHFESQRNLMPISASSVYAPGPGDPGFRCFEQQNLIPRLQLKKEPPKKKHTDFHRK
jgi:hypothetical protein